MAATERTIVRRATLADVEVLQSFPDADKVEETLAAADRGEVWYAVGEVDGRVVGAAVLDLVSELQPEVKRIWIVSDHRRQGVGSAITTWLEDKAREKGHEATFMVIDPENERMISMAVDLSYSATGDHIGLENPDEVHEAAESGDPAEGLFAIYRKSLTMA